MPLRPGTMCPNCGCLGVRFDPVTKADRCGECGVVAPPAQKAPYLEEMEATQRRGTRQLAELRAQDRERYEARLAAAARRGRCPFCGSNRITRGQNRSECESCYTNWPNRPEPRLIVRNDSLQGLGEEQKEAIRTMVGADFEKETRELIGAAPTTETRTPNQQRFAILAQRLGMMEDEGDES